MINVTTQNTTLNALSTNSRSGIVSVIPLSLEMTSGKEKEGKGERGRTVMGRKSGIRVFTVFQPFIHFV